jgi:hypothetical protein
MDTKITLSFDQEVIEKAKAYAEANHISLSRLTEILLRRLVNSSQYDLEDLPVSAWVNELSEGEAQYLRKSRSRKETKKEYFEAKK